MEERTTPKAEPAKVQAAKVKTWKTASGKTEDIPGLGFVINDAMLQNPNVIKAIENFEARKGKRIFGTVVVLR